MFTKKGFTLIELLIVIIIIGILASLAIPQYTKFVEKARAAEALAMIGALKTGQAAYKLESGGYSSQVTALNINNVPVTAGDAFGKGQFWYYGIAATDNTSYQILATRSTKAGGVTSDYIRFTWSDTTGVTWAGNHAGTPK